jgi:putative hydroxymethylpyrimidine transporter CytX
MDARYWKWLQRIGIVLLLALSVVMTWVVFTHHGIRELLAMEPAGGMPFMSGLDLVIAMPISWLPLASDYARYAKSDKGGFWGTWVGFLAASSWMFVVGLAAALATQTDKPDEMVMQLMASLGMALPALLIVMLSTFTTTFLDVYSNAVSVISIAPKLKERPVIIASGLIGTVLAVYFPAVQYENFLLFIGAMFCPLFGVVLTDYFAIKRGHYDAADLYERGKYWYTAGVNIRGVVAWVIGFAVYEAITLAGSGIGASLPSLFMSGMVYYLFMSRSVKETSSWPEPLASPARD